jgi:ribosomal protein L13E
MEPKVYPRGKARKARGYSYEELKSANMDIRDAKKLKVPVDKRRKTAYDENVNQLKTKMQAGKKPSKKKAVKGKSRKTLKPPPPKK